jgi:hypothetical protein
MSFPQLPIKESDQEVLARDNNREFGLYAFKYCAKACKVWEGNGDSLSNEQTECLSSHS